MAIHPPIAWKPNRLVDLGKGELVRKQHQQVAWDPALEHDLRHLVRMTVLEDLERQQDWTTISLVPPNAEADAMVVAREQGVIAGLPIAPIVIEEMNANVQWTPLAADGDAVAPQQPIAEIAGAVRDLLVAERTILNFIGKLSGVATTTAAFVEKTTGTRAKICDTRKTIPGWRRLQKYAVRQGGGTNHRLGLYDAILIKDNHIAFGNHDAMEPFDIAEAVERARKFAAASTPDPHMIIEVEVDSLEQLECVLPAGPDIVLLDNMSPDQLKAAVSLRDERYESVALEASGGVRLETVEAIAKTGVERISVGALTHSSPNFDIGLDWN